METNLAPDLERGRIVNGTAAPNAWCTAIQSVLEETVGGVTQTAWLSQECRKENVPFAPGGPGPEGGIVQKNAPAEFLTFTRDGRFYQLLGSEIPFGTALAERYQRVPLGRHFVFQPFGEEAWLSEVHCERRPIRLLAPEEVLAGLNARTLGAPELYLRFSWREGEKAFTLYAPSRYVNFANRGHAPDDYLQPISGYVLFRHDDLWLHGYLAVALRTDGAMLVELVAPVYTDAYAVIAKQTGASEADRAVLARLAETAPAYLRQFNLVLHLKGRLDFFRYE